MSSYKLGVRLLKIENNKSWMNVVSLFECLIPMHCFCCTKPSDKLNLVSLFPVLASLIRFLTEVSFEVELRER